MSTQNQSLREIVAAMAAWEDIRRDEETLLRLFGTGNMFSFVSDPANPSSMHAYPGIHEGQLHYYVIPSQFDKAETVNIEQYVQPCLLGFCDGNEEIPYEEAMKRINEWRDGYVRWITDQIAEGRSLYQAFFMPEDDFKKTNYTSYLALATDIDHPEERFKRADLILDDGDNEVRENLGAYMDTVRPVPPFKPSYAKETFHLLSMVAKEHELL
jgi:hypothetical protein